MDTLDHTNLLLHVAPPPTGGGGDGSSDVPKLLLPLPLLHLLALR